MAEISHIEWTDATWNIARGCTKVDSDCKYCYMYRDSLDSSRYDPKVIQRTKTVFDMPLRYKEKQSAVRPGKPLIFTSSLTDFFHEAIDSYRHEAWDIIRKCPHLIFQILTKRPERIAEHLPEDWGSEGWPNVWLGTSVGSPEGLHRIDHLIEAAPAVVRFVSFEPLHKDITADVDSELSFEGWAAEMFPFIDWAIIGGESGNNVGKSGYRPCNVLWMEKLIDSLQSHGTQVFVKQLGTYLSKEMGLKDRHGRDINEFPESLRIRQFPD